MTSVSPKTTGALPTLGIFGPRAPYKSAAARYIEQSLPHLGRHFRCVHVGPNDQRHPGEFDQVLYHLGNDPLHIGALQALLQRPGPVLLHEYHLAGLDRWAGHGNVQWLAVEQATEVLVHNRDVAHLLTSRYPHVRVSALPYPVAPATGMSLEAARERFGLPQHAYVFASLGCRLGRHERLDAVLEGWRLWQDRPADTVLVLAGSVDDEIALPADPSIRPLGYVDYQDLDALMLACDCAIQLRHPVCGETLWAARQLAAHNRPVIGTHLPETRDLTLNEAVTLIPPGFGEPVHLLRAMRQQRERPRLVEVFDDTNSWHAWRDAILPSLAPDDGIAGVGRPIPRLHQAMSPNLENLYSVCSPAQSEVVAGVLRAGQHLLDTWPGNAVVGQSELGVRIKTDGSQVSRADYNSQDILLSVLQLTHPGALVVSEEDEQSHQSAGDTLWFVDPLDGTSQYLAGSPDFAILLSAWTGHRPDFSVVHFPAPGLTGVAVAGAAAFQASDSPPSDTAVVHTVYCDPPGLRKALPTGTRYLVDHAEATRVLTDVARGFASGAVVRMCGQQTWDIAAPIHLLRAAGAVVSDERGHALAMNGPQVEAKYLVASRTAALHSKLLHALTGISGQGSVPHEH
ncbi:hypothetical protein GCM10010441_29430 [Kitasatospora paracochleata]|uniref:3'-phosphoadenosine 5'-phosphosulfate (PAPS) 3'-phosphatase n=1 Tax=Kitasatospora paracochleata TaxID=58354 RepID=A0ABT1J9W8_9ACTN|nr:inositol monophosphatase family protein [Kitasatospora paracochleata]MCP2313904.1 3'-phosphoadenosine 5'-phosphosulfate (PAPS) 3'-phosphatase [Kitasatospora paracochleata]